MVASFFTGTFRVFFIALCAALVFYFIALSLGLPANQYSAALAFLGVCVGLATEGVLALLKRSARPGSGPKPPATPPGSPQEKNK